MEIKRRQTGIAARLIRFHAHVGWLQGSLRIIAEFKRDTAKEFLVVRNVFGEQLGALLGVVEQLGHLGGRGGGMGGADEFQISHIFTLFHSPLFTLSTLFIHLTRALWPF